ncbi:MAG: radical SAM protein [Promethearchaeota archaeon]
MSSEIIYLEKGSKIPLFGIDFIGVIDRGTNIIELKPLTLCNLRCRYCFVSSGDYNTNFIVRANYLIEKVKELIEVKGKYNIEIHLAPYGEILLYPELLALLKKLKNIEGIEIISMQSNGVLLNEDLIQKLEQYNLTRINISINTLNKQLAEYLCDCKNYNIDRLKKNINSLLNSKIDVLIAPVWFPGRNDKDIEDIIKFTREFRNKGFSERKIQIGIQKYLIYKTGRKLKRTRPKTWKYFYHQLSLLEKKYNLKLKLGPNDFGIHKREKINNLNLKKGDIINLEIISKGRWKNECIGRISENFGIKVLLQKPFVFSNSLLEKQIKVRVLKANYKDNIITAVFPI